MKFLSFALVCCSALCFGQNIISIPETTRTLPYDLQSGTSAVVVTYQSDAAMLMSGNSNTPSPQVVLETIKTFIIEKGIDVVALVSYAQDESIERSYLSELLLEKDPDFLITFTLQATENIGIFTGTPVSYCDPYLEIGLLCGVQIAPYSKQEAWYSDINPIYYSYKGSLSQLISEVKLNFTDQEQRTEGQIQYQEELYKLGTIHYGLPKDFSEAPLYISEPEETIIVGNTKGFVKKIMVKANNVNNKHILKTNKEIRKLCSGYKYNFQFASQLSNALSENNTGYILKMYSSYYKISDLFTNQELLGTSNTADTKFLARFQCETRPALNSEACPYVYPTKHYYHYLKSLATGDIYLLDYSGYTGDEPGAKSLEVFLDHVSKG